MLDDYQTVMKAIADPTRARILKMLENGELSAGDIIEVLRGTQSTVSGHLSVLRSAGLVRDRKEGRWSYYSLDGGRRNQYAAPMLALLHGWLEDDPGVRADRRRLAALSRAARGCS